MNKRMKPSYSLHSELVTEALAMAIWRRKPGAGLIMHSDRGVQYTSQVYQLLLKQHQIVCSISRKGNCWDNACAESFFHTLKTELVYHCLYEDRDQARKSVLEYIEMFHNCKRLHSHLDYQAPSEFESRYAA